MAFLIGREVRVCSYLYSGIKMTIIQKFLLPFSFSSEWGENRLFYKGDLTETVIESKITKPMKFVITSSISFLQTFYCSLYFSKYLYLLNLG